jgi:hypothetical protein
MFFPACVAFSDQLCFSVASELLSLAEVDEFAFSGSEFITVVRSTPIGIVCQLRLRLV